MKKNDLSLLNAHLAAQVRTYRIQLTLTLRELDEALALPGGTVSRIERGDKRLDCLTLQRLATYLNLSVDVFFENAPDVQISAFAPLTSGVGVADVEILLEAYKVIENPDVRRDILSLVRSVADSPLNN